ncbi:carbohydrate-binding protein [Thraustotheca clavata]|uniref:Carbohydrate-binding protein n=1 Tax=Thraustotheca clavata TaxID=74557 RepID=A0A1W0A7M9_9STRA|nr:carbohydrate-binding protein [Thraustotheca clavata]
MAERDPLLAMEFRSRSSLRTLVYIVAALAITSCGIATILRNGTPSFQQIYAGKIMSLDANLPRRPDHCPNIAPHERVVLFWQSEVQGCELIPDGVTHVLFGFAQVEAGEVIPRFQTSDDIIMSCIQSLRKRCIYSLGVVGGANNNAGMASVRDPPRFVNSVLALVHKYQLDGVDIDDETNYLEAGYSSRGIVAYMTALRYAFRAEKLILTYDAYITEANPRCYKGMRCFARGVEHLVDWVNVMAYNIDKNPWAAAKAYEAAVHETFPLWQRRLPKDKITIGLCTGVGCAWGPGPSQQVINDYINYAKGAGGIMIYSGSADLNQGFYVTRDTVIKMHQTPPPTTIRPTTQPPKTTTPRPTTKDPTPPPTTQTPRPTTQTPLPTTQTPSPTTATTIPKTEAATSTPVVTTTSVPTTTQAPATTVPSGGRNADICGSCFDCFYEPTKSCFNGWNEAQCKSLSFTWCGNST